jgi:membrane protein DedA with SNARE-associated domain
MVAWALDVSMMSSGAAGDRVVTASALAGLGPDVSSDPLRSTISAVATRATATRQLSAVTCLSLEDTLMTVTLLTVLTSEISSAPDSGLAGWTVDLMEKLGLFGAGLAVGMDNLFPPIPSEIILPLAGFAASQGTFSLTGALIATTLGSVTGAVILYWLGAIFGRERAVMVFDKVPLLKVSDLEKTEAWFAKHGGKAVFFGRMVPIFRSLISLPAGVEKMNFGLFFLLTTAGSLIWNSIFVIAGYRLGENWDAVEPYANLFQKVVIGGVLLVIVVFVVVRLRQRSADDRA